MKFFNDVIKSICQGGKWFVLAQEIDNVADDIGPDTRTELSQVDWPAEQTMDPSHVI